ncbi:MAG: hypothetical protein HDT07_00610 [Bacteroidales bacterium]|nr:hypothetical protein [Bacteroidales bacterium]
MKKIFISAAVVLASLSMSAKVFTVGDVQQVNGVSVDQPVIAADGSFVVTPAAKGLQKIDLASGETEIIVNGDGISRVAISPDGNTIAYVKTTFDKNHLSYKSLQTVNLETQKQETVVKPTRNLAAGVALTDAQVAGLNNGKVAKKAVSKTAAPTRPVVAVNYGHLTVNGKTIDPQGKGSYLWPSLSPDGTKIVYWLVYRGCFVCDLDGSNVQPVGGLRAAVWAGNDAVIGMDEKEGNAQVVEASSLVAFDLNSGEKQVLTPATVKAQFPSVDANATRVAFTDPDGKLYYMNLSK